MKIDPSCQKFLKRVGTRIRKARLEKGWSLEEAEEKGAGTWQHLQKVETGKNATLATLWKIAKGLGMSPAELIGE